MKFEIETLEDGRISVILTADQFARVICPPRSAPISVPESSTVKLDRLVEDLISKNKVKRNNAKHPKPKATKSLAQVFKEPDPASPRGAILAAIRKGPPRTSIELSDFLNLTPPTIYNACGAFKEAGIIGHVLTESGKGWAPK